MKVRKVKRLCSVKGCKNTESYAVTRSTEFGGLIICADCLRDALRTVTGLEKNEKKAGEKE